MRAARHRPTACGAPRARAGRGRQCGRRRRSALPRAPTLRPTSSWNRLLTGAFVREIRHDAAEVALLRQCADELAVGLRIVAREYREARRGPGLAPITCGRARRRCRRCKRKARDDRDEHSSGVHDFLLRGGSCASEHDSTCRVKSAGGRETPSLVPTGSTAPGRLRRTSLLSHAGCPARGAHVPRHLPQLDLRPVGCHLGRR